MKFAIMADIHANLEAFEAVLKDSKSQTCTHYAFLGDFVGYCADPKECLAIVRALDAPCVKGNHDEYCATDAPLDGFNPRAAKLLEWTRRQLSAEDRRWLRDLSYVRTIETFTIVHATLEAPERWGYVFDKLAAAASFNHQQTPICFFGHIHVPVAFVKDTAVRGGTYTTFGIEKGKQYFVNVGAVGQPRDNSPKAAYVIYDTDKGVIDLRRVAYDIETTRRKIRDAGLAP
jgi:diadenosine tetraphosphatase ApaH/serine/threonine PP2A family protein phosphatase